MEREVQLAEVLAAREARAQRQRALLAERGLPLVSFCMNIAGPVKRNPAIRRGFDEGLARLRAALRGARMKIEHMEQIDAPTGCEALLVVRGEARAIKERCVELEDEDALGRLFDLDVISPDGEKLEREQFGLPPRRCLICGLPGKGCASRRTHTVAELQARTRSILRDCFAARDDERIAAQAVRALLYEVCATPKPGLVDRANSGSHRDMDIFTFVDSAAALIPYLRGAVALGRETSAAEPAETFRLLRREGLRAEREMFIATRGVNTHKGAIFSMGTACAAAGRLWTVGRPRAKAEEILRECGRMSAQAVAEDLRAVRAGEADTAGQRLYLQTGRPGIRGELAEGLPSVEKIALPALREARAKGATLEQAGLYALLRLISGVDDSNLYARGGADGQRWAAEQAGALAAEGQLPPRDKLEALDRAFIARNLSPGGCADLLAIACFLLFLEEEVETERPVAQKNLQDSENNSELS